MCHPSGRPIQIHLLFILASIVGHAHFARAVATNRTIDDTNGDAITGLKPIYEPPELWVGDFCISSDCVPPNKSEAFGGTFHAVNYGIYNYKQPSSPQARSTLSFNGTAIYVYFTLYNWIILPKKGPVTTSVNFTMDNDPPRAYQYIGNTSADEFLYQTLVHSQDNLTNGPHTLIISPFSYVNFDYAIYTFENETVSPPSATKSNASTPSSYASPPSSRAASLQAPIVIGASIAGLLSITSIALLTRCIYQRRRRQKNARRAVPYPDQPLTDSEQTQRRLLPSEKRRKALRRGNSTTNAAPSRLAHQEALERRLMTLEQDIQKMATTLSTREAELATSQREPGARVVDQEMSTNQLRERMEAMRTQAACLEQQRHSDWAEGLSYDLPPRYTQEYL